MPNAIEYLWIPPVLVALAFVTYRRLPARARALADRLSIFDLWDLWQGLIAVGLLVFLAYVLAEDAVADRNTRLVLAATLAALAVVAVLGLGWRRWRGTR